MKPDGIKRKLKPVIEKKRRDRINHNLEALRDLLFKNTADSRLQNPKLEKAEILDLAVEFIKKTTRMPDTKMKSSHIDSKVFQCKPVLSFPHPNYSIDFSRSLRRAEEETLWTFGTTSASRTQEPVPKTGFFLPPAKQSFHAPHLHHEFSLYGSPVLCKSASPSYSSSSSVSQFSSPPTSPTFNSTSSSLSPSPPPPSKTCPPPTIASNQTSFSIQAPVFVSQHTMAHMGKDFTPPQSPVMAFRQELFPHPNHSAWRPWS